MSPSAYITPRDTKSGKRYVVRYRLGGRDTKLVHAGSFDTMKAARDRRDFVISCLASGKDPRRELATLAREQRAPRTFAQVAEAWRESRVDYADETMEGARSHVRQLCREFDGRPEDITVEDIQAWIGRASERLKPGSLRPYISTLRQILDYAGVEPNPARDRRVKLPAVVVEEPKPPTAKHVLAMLERIPAALRLPLVTIEQTAMTVGEAEALAWGDVDVAGSQFRLRRRTVKAGRSARARWVQVPDWLMGLIEDTCAPEDRTSERRVFSGFTDGRARRAMTAACKTAGVPHYHPHDFRHRRISLWHGQGIPARELAERAGHARPTLSLDVYSHVMPLDEVPAERYQEVLA